MNYYALLGGKPFKIRSFTHPKNLTNLSLII